MLSTAAAHNAQLTGAVVIYAESLTLAQAIERSNAFEPEVKAKLHRLAHEYETLDCDIALFTKTLHTAQRRIREARRAKARIGAALNKVYGSAPRIPHAKRKAKQVGW